MKLNIEEDDTMWQGVICNRTGDIMECDAVTPRCDTKEEALRHLSSHPISGAEYKLVTKNKVEDNGEVQAVADYRVD